MTEPICLITGGSGFLGINLARMLLQRGGCIVRTLDLLPFDYPERPQVDARVGDIRNLPDVEAALHGVSHVVHAAAALPLADAAEIRSTNVDGTQRLLDAAWREGVERFVFTSSTAVYGVPDHHPIVEGDALSGVGPYGVSKIEAERACRAARERGQCVTVLRPKTFIGPERLGVFELLYEWAWSGRSFPVLGRGDNHYQLLDVEDLCGLIVRCLTLDATLVNDTFNVAAVSFGTMRENVQAVLDRAGHGRRAVSLPVAPTIALLRMLRALRLSPLYEWIYETAARESVVSVDKAVRQLGYAPRHSNRTALMRNYDWYVANRSRHAGRHGITHRVPWSRGVLALARHLF